MDPKAKQPTPLPRWAEDVRASLPPLMSRVEASVAARCSAKSIDRRVRDGSLTAVHIGSRVLIPRDSIIALLAGRNI